MTILTNRRLLRIFGISTLLFLLPFFYLQAMTVSPVRLELSGDPGTTRGEECPRGVDGSSKIPD